MLSRTEAITLTAQGIISPYSKLRPLYAGSHKRTLQEVLHGAGLTFSVSSSLIGESNLGDPMTLEEFLIRSNITQPATKSISLSIGNRAALSLQVTDLYVKEDILFMRVVGGGRECKREGPLLITSPSYPIGLEDHHVRSITKLELEGGLSWKQ
jgi:hypothetical protein